MVDVELDTVFCTSYSCPNEATNADGLCDHCRKWRIEVKVTRRRCSFPGCDELQHGLTTFCRGHSGPVWLRIMQGMENATFDEDAKVWR